MITIIDYGVGNLFSLSSSLRFLGLENRISGKKEDLVQADISLKPKAAPVEMEMEQISLFDTVKDDDIITEIRELDLSNMTPLDALNTMYRLQNKIKNRW